jgi:hypothetical protein
VLTMSARALPSEALVPARGVIGGGPCPSCTRSQSAPADHMCPECRHRLHLFIIIIRIFDDDTLVC